MPFGMPNDAIGFDRVAVPDHGNRVQETEITLRASVPRPNVTGDEGVEMTRSRSKNPDFTDRVNRLIKERSLTIRVVSEHTGIPISSVHALLNGALSTDYQGLKKLASLLCVSLEWLLTGVEHVVTSEPIGVTGDELFSGIVEVTIRRHPAKSTQE